MHKNKKKPSIQRQTEREEDYCNVTKKNKREREREKGVCVSV
jgi:hypothetical protein